jgi:hypothetical protein
VAMGFLKAMKMTPVLVIVLKEIIFDKNENSFNHSSMWKCIVCAKC